MLDLRRIRYFVAVYEEGSIKRAAQRENIVQPAVSVQIRQLEAELALQLFDRSTQGIQPTPAAHHFYRLCADLLRRLQMAEQEMLDYGGSIAGAIAIGIMPSICRGVLPGIVGRFAAAYPAVTLKLVEGYSGSLAEQLASGELDVAICNRPAPQTLLKQRLIVRERLVLVSGPDGRPEPGRPCRLADIDQIQLILPAQVHMIRRVLDRHMKRLGVRPARIIEIDALGVTMETVRGGGWSTILPQVAVLEDLDGPDFRISPIASPILTSDIYELRLPERPPPAPAQRLVEMIEEALVTRRTTACTGRGI
jgi:LysR family nitrogen assimilation transcriptional regulator